MHLQKTFNTGVESCYKAFLQIHARFIARKYRMQFERCFDFGSCKFIKYFTIGDKWYFYPKGDNSRGRTGGE